MVPADLKGGGTRDEQVWSCYDPLRSNREAYEDLQMPSSAMTAAKEGNLIESVDGGEYNTSYHLKPLISQPLIKVDPLL